MLQGCFGKLACRSFSTLHGVVQRFTQVNDTVNKLFVQAMPAAEIAGLAIGTIALATLFSTCIELFDLFEVGKNCIYDYDLACLKISLLRERLRAWGSTLHVREPGAEDTALRHQWPTKREIVAASLIGLRRILSDSEVLTQKYDMSVSSIGFRRRTVWSIRDKAKFERLIQDISFLVDGLEKITADRSSATGKADENDVVYRRESLNDWEPAPKRPTKEIVTTRLIAEGQAGAPFKCYHWVERIPGRPSHGSSSNSEHVVSGTQYNRHRSIGVQGVLGHNQTACCVEGIQVNCDNAVGIQGATSTEAVGYLQRQAIARGNFANASSG